MSNLNSSTSSSADGCNLYNSDSEPKVGSIEGRSKDLGGNENFKLQVLSNDLIWDHITPYLTHNQLKKTMLVCKKFFKRIRVNHRFQDSSVARLTGSDFTHPHFTRVNDLSLIWKSSKIHIDPILNNFVCRFCSSVRQRFKDTETLQIFLLESVQEFYCPFLQILLSAISVEGQPPLRNRGLRSLTLPSALLDYESLGHTLNNPLVQGVLRNLKELHVTSSSRHRLIRSWLFDSDPIAMDYNVRKLFVSTQLEQLSWEPSERQGNFLSQILHSSSRTLSSLSIGLLSRNDNDWREISQIQFTVLRHLKLSRLWHCSEHIIRFLEKMPPLVSLDMVVHNGVLGTGLLEETIARVHGSSLKRVRFATHGRNTGYHIIVTGHFFLRHHLSTMNQLESCDLSNVCHGNCSGFGRMLYALPKRISQLTFRRIVTSQNRSWNGMEWICIFCTNSFFESPDPAEYISDLQEFANLTELNIIGVPKGELPGFGSVIDDSILQLITETLKKLKILRFSRCYKLTDYGLTGCLPDGQRTGTAISAGLNDLHQLLIKDCPLVTAAGLLASLKFQHLTSLYLVTGSIYCGEFRKNPAIERTLVGIVEQNPCLSSLMIHSHIPDIANTLKEANPWLANVINVHYRGCGVDSSYFEYPYEDY